MSVIVSYRHKKFGVYVTQINLALIAGKLQHILISHTKTVDDCYTLLIIHIQQINYTYSANKILQLSHNCFVSHRHQKFGVFMTHHLHSICHL